MTMSILKILAEPSKPAFGAVLVAAADGIYVSTPWGSASAPYGGDMPEKPLGFVEPVVLDFSIFKEWLPGVSEITSDGRFKCGDIRFQHPDGTQLYDAGMMAEFPAGGESIVSDVELNGLDVEKILSLVRAANALLGKTHPTDDEFGRVIAIGNHIIVNDGDEHFLSVGIESSFPVPIGFPGSLFVQLSRLPEGFAKNLRFSCSSDGKFSAVLNEKISLRGRMSAVNDVEFFEKLASRVEGTSPLFEMGKAEMQVLQKVARAKSSVLLSCFGRKLQLYGISPKDQGQGKYAKAVDLVDSEVVGLFYVATPVVRAIAALSKEKPDAPVLVSVAGHATGFLQNQGNYSLIVFACDGVSVASVCLFPRSAGEIPSDVVDLANLWLARHE